MALAFISLHVYAKDSHAASQMNDAAGEQRIALVIGNGDYKTAPLRNPPNDARLMARTLRGLGFDVIDASMRIKRPCAAPSWNSLRGCRSWAAMA